MSLLANMESGVAFRQERGEEYRAREETGTRDSENVRLCHEIRRVEVLKAIKRERRKLFEADAALTFLEQELALINGEAGCLS